MHIRFFIANRKSGKKYNELENSRQDPAVVTGEFLAYATEAKEKEKRRVGIWVLGDGHFTHENI